MGNYRLIIMILQESLESDLDPCLHCYMTFEFFRVSALKKNVIFIIIFFYQNINITLLNIVHIFAYFVHRISVHFPAKFDLSLYLVALGNSHVSHIIRHTAHADVAALHDTYSGAHPGGKSFLHFSVRPVSYDNFSLDSHTGYDMSVLSSAVSRLVLVHEVHIDGVIGDFLIKLGMQMAQRFSVFLQSQNPGFCRRESMHPGDHSGAVLIRVRLVKSLTDQLIGDQSGLPYQLERQDARFIQFLHDDTGMLRNLPQTLVAIEILGACAEPELVISSCFHKYILLLGRFLKKISEEP